MYASSKAFYNFYIANRDTDSDGLCEWGAHAVLESVRDGLVAVWDEVTWPANLDGVDINSMIELLMIVLNSMIFFHEEYELSAASPILPVLSAILFLNYIFNPAPALWK